MNSSKIDTPKILLIILGVLAAIVIGFSSKAIGSNSTLKIQDSSKTKIEGATQNFLKKSSKAMAKPVIDYFTSI